MTDMQAAIGAAQIDKLPLFCERRKENFSRYNKIFEKYSDYLILPVATEHSDPSWFSYIVTVRENAPFKRDQLTKYLGDNLIETRNLFAGNMARQPSFIGKNFRIAENLNNSDYIMNNTFFLGTYPGNTPEKLDYIEEVITDFMKKY
jgi:CDP-6-deoxy-D-xylo-4-hexulose-3-dehydrase